MRRVFETDSCPKSKHCTNQVWFVQPAMDVDISCCVWKLVDESIHGLLPLSSSRSGLEWMTSLLGSFSSVLFVRIPFACLPDCFCLLVLVFVSLFACWFVLFLCSFVCLSVCPSVYVNIYYSFMYFRPVFVSHGLSGGEH